MSNLFSNTEFDIDGNQPLINLSDGAINERVDLNGDNKADYLDEAIEVIQHYKFTNSPGTNPGEVVHNFTKLNNAKISMRCGQSGGSTTIPVSGFATFGEQMTAIRNLMGTIALMSAGLVTTARTRLLETAKYDVPSVGIGGTPRPQTFNYRVSPFIAAVSADPNLASESVDVSLKVPFFLPERLMMPNPDYDSDQPESPTNPSHIPAIVGVATLADIGQFMGQFIRKYAPDDIVTFLGTGGGRGR